MKLGFLTACLPGDSLEEIAAFASTTGFEALEVAAWPGSDTRPFTATHVVVDPLTPGEVTRVRRCLDDHGLSVSSLAYYGNNLHPDRGERRATNDHVAAASRPPPSSDHPRWERSSDATPADRWRTTWPPPRRSSRHWSTRRPPAVSTS